jgi:hypothetical protein
MKQFLNKQAIQAMQRTTKGSIENNNNTQIQNKNQKLKEQPNN